MTKLIIVLNPVTNKFTSKLKLGENKFKSKKRGIKGLLIVYRDDDRLIKVEVETELKEIKEENEYVMVNGRAYKRVTHFTKSKIKPPKMTEGQRKYFIATGNSGYTNFGREEELIPEDFYKMGHYGHN